MLDSIDGKYVDKLLYDFTLEVGDTLLREFVEKIVVHECSYDENGTRRQDIEIYYSFVGKVDLPE